MSHVLRALLVWALLLAGCVVLFIALSLWPGAERSWLGVEGPVVGGSIAAWFGVQFGRAASSLLCAVRCRR